MRVRVLLACFVAASAGGCGSADRSLPAKAAASTNTLVTAGLATVNGTLVPLPPTSEAPAGAMLLSRASTPGNPLFSVTVEPASATGLPGLLGLRRAAATRALSANGFVTIAAVVVQASQTLAFASGPGFMFTLPGSVAHAPAFRLAYYRSDRMQWDVDWAQPASTAGAMLTFGSNGAPFTFLAGIPQTFAVLRASGVSPSPAASALASATPGFTPAPGPSSAPAGTPTPAPTTPAPATAPTIAPVFVSAAALDLIAGGTPASATVLVSQSGQAPSFTPAVQCSPASATVVVVTPGTATASTRGGSVSFAVTAGSSGGVCSVTFTSTAGGTPAVLAFNVSLTNLNVQSAGRRR